MKNRPLGVGVLLLGMAAIGYVVLSWVEHPNTQRTLDLKSAELEQPNFEIALNKAGEIGFPLLLEKKSGATYRFITNPEPMWVQMQYAPQGGGTGVLPWIPTRKHLTAEELNKKIKSGQRLRLEEVLNADRPVGAQKQNKR